MCCHKDGQISRSMHRDRLVIWYLELFLIHLNKASRPGAHLWDYCPLKQGHPQHYLRVTDLRTSNKDMTA